MAPWKLSASLGPRIRQAFAWVVVVLSLTSLGGVLGGGGERLTAGGSGLVAASWVGFTGSHLFATVGILAVSLTWMFKRRPRGRQAGQSDGSPARRVEARPWQVELPLTPTDHCREEVTRLSGMLHDAWIARHGSDLAEDGIFRVALERIGYEDGRWKPLLRWIPRTIYPGVPCVLTVSGVQEVVQELDEGAVWAEDEDQLLCLRLLSEGFELFLGRDFGETHLHIGEDAVLRLRDTGGEAQHRPGHHFIGPPILNESEIELLRLYGPLGPWDADPE